MRCAFFLLAILTTASLGAHEAITTNLTWSRDIAPLVQIHCAACHRPGGSAMSLLTYADARPWAKAIRDEVLGRTMPPWDAVKGVGDFRGDMSLSQPQMDLFVSWVEGGAPEGDPTPALVPNQPPRPQTPKSTPRSFSKSVTLHRPITLVGVRPDGPVEVVACLPDQSIQRLLWVEDFRQQWNRTYVLRSPTHLPSGTRILLYGPSNASATLFTTPARAR